MTDEPLSDQPVEPAPEDWQAKAEEYLNAWKRAAADFDNYQKRRVKEDRELVIFTKQVVLMKLLPTLTALEQALRHAPQEEANPAWRAGIEETMRRFAHTLAELGIERIPTVGEKFSHELHEAVEMVEGAPAGTITEEVAPGFKISGHVVQPAKVKVAK